VHCDQLPPTRHGPPSGQVICHGIPDARELADGDIVNVDVTAYLGGWHGDLNETFCVGQVCVALIHDVSDVFLLRPMRRMLGTASI
jgi:methionine aminopeptidase